MFRRAYWLVGIVLLVSSPVMAEIVVHEPNFVVDKIMDSLGGQIPRLEAVRNPAYGNGVVVAHVKNGILTVVQVVDSFIKPLSVLSGLSGDSFVLDIRFDPTGVFQNNLYVSIGRESGSGTRILEINPYSSPIERLSRSDITLLMDFTYNNPVFPEGVTLWTTMIVVIEDFITWT